MSLTKGPEELQKEVRDRDMCTTCGLCVGMCPYIKTAREKVVNIYSCGIKEGNCYKVCPRTQMDVDGLDRAVYGVERNDYALGLHRGLHFARAKDNSIASVGQYGGVVTSLMVFAMETGMIEGAVLTRGSGGHMPEPVIARSRQDILSCVGSKYTAVPTLAALNQAVREGLDKVGVVGRPCQVAAIRKMQHTGLKEPEMHNNSAASCQLVIGLFCFWALAPEFYDFMNQHTGGADIVRIDIPVEGLVVETTEGVIQIPVEEIRPFIKPTCQECFDCTSEWADVSVGSTEYDPAWNTLVVRTDKGEALIKAALEAGVIEIRPYPPEREPLLRRAVLNKKVRVIESQLARGEEAYLQLSDGYKEKTILALKGVD